MSLFAILSIVKISVLIKQEFLDSEYGKELIYESLENDLNHNDRFERSRMIVNR